MKIKKNSWLLLFFFIALVSFVLYFGYFEFNFLMFLGVVFSFVFLFKILELYRFRKGLVGDIAKPLYEFINPFLNFRDNNFSKSFWIAIFILVLPVIIIVLNRGSLDVFEGEMSILDSKIEAIAFWGIWLSIVGILISSRVYFEITNRNSLNFDQFTTITLKDFVDNSENIPRDESSSQGNQVNQGNKIQMILPTPFIGYNHKPKFHENFKNKIIQLAKSKKNIFTLAILKFDIKEINSVLEIIEQNKSGTLADMCNEFESPILKFHHNWYQQNSLLNEDNAKKERIKFYKNLCEFLKELYELSNCAENKFEIKHLRLHYFNNFENECGMGNKDIFLLSNTTKGNYVLGDLKILEQESIVFEHNVYDNTNIGEEFSAFFDKFTQNRV
ncbi:MAG: hypothetical protein J0L86_05420 [Flavobacteriales bacterium]|nr:hypothetical protein [Flavobacteriales bacterium]